jgi:hypothetical protein
MMVLYDDRESSEGKAEARQGLVRDSLTFAALWADGNEGLESEEDEFEDGWDEEAPGRGEADPSPSQKVQHMNENEFLTGETRRTLINEHDRKLVWRKKREWEGPLIYFFDKAREYEVANLYFSGFTTEEFSTDEVTVLGLVSRIYGMDHPYLHHRVRLMLKPGSTYNIKHAAPSGVFYLAEGENIRRTSQDDFIRQASGLQRQLGPAKS